MTRVIKKKLYCNHCKKSYEVPVIMSTNSFMIQNDPILRKRAEDGTLFKNFCPVWKEELVNKEDE